MSGYEVKVFMFVSGLIGALGYWGVLVAMALESAGIPIPSEIIMPLAGYEAKLGHLNFWLVVLAGTLGNVVGAAVAYYIGRAGGRPLLLRYGKYILISHTELERAEHWFARYGQITVMISRVLPVVRTYFSFPAGAARMPFSRFVLYTFIGSLPWAIALAWVGVVLGEHHNQLDSIFRVLNYVVVAGLLLAAGWYVYTHLRRRAETPPTPVR
jgi:membrane protein DedA with SNARE-associated domain